MENLREEFDRSDIIRDMIDKIRGIVVDESNNGREKVEVFVSIMFIVECFVDKNILSDDCVICFEELGKEGEVMCTPCSHVFHEDCIAKWLEKGNSCPICRHDLSDI
ncbi:E3 ubiquitin-protein ligase RING1-like [Solanum pennellii]|uniref:RING-type E3 ubiquitin transferase n=1 Tax=Solanum pennellii TaxID=28526 RepID=A0ABM1V0S9_SOLPN|nr:E3 ubiquitin-protein ligase RING1-like [Solanum pennellii]